MKDTGYMTMKENLKFKMPNAAEIYYFRWTTGEPYTIMAADGKKYGNIITIGYRHELDFLNWFDLPMYHRCPFN